MSDLHRNNELKNFISELVYADRHENISSADQLKIITLYEPMASSTRDTMCTDFCEIHAKIIIKILNNNALSTDKELLIDELYMNIEHEIKAIIEDEAQLKIECDADYYDEHA
jgi:hypothetical protein